MAGTQRKCANCRYFHDAGLSGNGWCTHPKRQHNSDVKMLVRAGELACRNSWGGDLFLDRNAPAPDPMADADLPGSAQEDEVTSVVVPGERSPARPAEDRVVSDRPAARLDEDRNDAAHAEQAERARIIARGSRDAIMQARQRASSRRAGLIQADDDGTDTAQERVHTHQARFTDRDFSMHITDHPGASGPVPRDEIRDRFRAAPGEERFESVPELDPDFELPAARRRQRPPDAEPAAAPDPEPAAAPEPQAATPTAGKNAVASRARRVREAKQRQAARPLRHSDLRLANAHPGSFEAREPASAAPGNPSEPEEVVARIDMRAEAAPPPADDTVLDPARWRHEPERDVDIPSDHRESRGWLSRGRRREAAPMPHDDAMVTRHASTLPWLEELDDPADTHPAAPAPRGEPWVDPAPVPRHERTMPAPDTSGLQERRRRGMTDDRPDGSRPRHDWIGGRPDAEAQVVTRVTYSAAPSREPIQVERPVTRPAADADGGQRRRLASQLPDLDDSLFEERFEERVERGTAAMDATFAAEPARRDDPEPLPREEAARAAEVARSSYFRASRFRDWSTSEREREPGDEPAVAPQRLPDMAESGFDAREAAARGSEALDMTIDIAPEIPRTCRTCRSFRAADGGARGWCTNEWAFTHRRMVNEDDLACDSTIGCWWLPADRYLISEDDDGFASPTPRMDALIARRDDMPARRTSGA